MGVLEWNRGIAHPIAQIWTGAMMRERLGHPEAVRAIVAAIETVVADGGLGTCHRGGDASTSEAGQTWQWRSSHEEDTGRRGSGKAAGVRVAPRGPSP